MKKTYLLIVSLIIITGTAFSSCTAKEETGDPARMSSVSKREENIFRFDTYDDLYEWIFAEKNGQRDEKVYGDRYDGFIGRLKNGEAGLYVPYYKGEPVALREKEGFEGIAFMTSELYGLPWIWYFTEYQGQETVIKCACIYGDDLKKLDREKASEMIKSFGESAPNVDNYETKPGYKKISDVFITFDGTEVPALLSELSDRTDVYLQFAGKDTLVILTGPGGIVNGSYAKDLSLCEKRVGEKDS